MNKQSRIPWLRHLRDIEKHLEKNEKWLQHPEKHMNELEEQLQKWNADFLEIISELEKEIEDK